MARPGIEFKDVERIARKIFSQGMSPTVQKIRDELGTGSNTTIARHLNTWRESFSEKHSPALPESVPDDLMSPLDDFWATAVAKAESNYQKYKEELDQKLADAESEKSNAIEQLELQSKENIQLSEKIQSLDASFQALERKYTALVGKNEVLQKELDNSHQLNEQMAATIKDQQQSFDSSLSETLSHQKEELAVLLTRTEEAENRRLLEIDQLRQTCKQLDSDSKEQRDSFVKQVDDLKQRESVLLSKLSKSEQQCAQAETALSKAEKISDQSLDQIATLQSQLTSAMESVSSFTDHFAHTKKTETDIAAQVDGLSKLLPVIHHEIKEYRNEHPDKN